ncbi:MAG: ABC transporter permease [Bacteroidales bacterium]|nr:ABC transporter permease [Bacteroidales bacterium]
MRDIFTEIWATARNNKLRTVLTGFAVAWGIFMLITLLGAGNGLIHGITQQSEGRLANSMVVYGGTTSIPYNGLKEGRYIRVKNSDINITATEFPGVIDDVGAMLYQGNITISNGANYISTYIAGVGSNHNKINKIEMLLGRYINQIDIDQRRKVLVISNKQAEELNPKNWRDMLGKYVKVNSFAFRVVGIFKDEENGRADAFSSYTTIQTIFNRGDDAGRIEFTFHGLPDEASNEAFENLYRTRLNVNHQAAPEDQSSFWLWNRFTQNLQMQDGMAIIRTFLWVVGLFTLLSGIVGVGNIMLITVKERTREFGIRKAIGAKPWSILKMIIIESVIITTFFGYIGMFLGVVATEIMDRQFGHSEFDMGWGSESIFVNPTVDISTCIEATLVLVIAGTIAGLIPSIKAARIRPINALNG